jgi:hypothetical protein
MIDAQRCLFRVTQAIFVDCSFLKNNFEEGLNVGLIVSCLRKKETSLRDDDFYLQRRNFERHINFINDATI